MSAETRTRPRRSGPLRRIVSRERHGSLVTIGLECGHRLTERYTGWKHACRCEQCEEQGRG